MYQIKNIEEQRLDKQRLSGLKWKPDVYFESLVLTNKLGINNYEALNPAERQITSIKIADAIKNPIPGSFDLKHLQDTHRHIFGDIYYFAGELRDVPMEIDSVTRFERPELLAKKLDSFFLDLNKDNLLKGLPEDKFIEKTARYLTRLNILHPFREGNGRSKRTFFSALAENAGYKLDWHKVPKEQWKLADESAFDNARDGQYDDSYLKMLLKNAVSPIAASGSAKAPMSAYDTVLAISKVKQGKADIETIRGLTFEINGEPFELIDYVRQGSRGTGLLKNARSGEIFAGKDFPQNNQLKWSSAKSFGAGANALTAAKTFLQAGQVFE